MCMSAPLFYSAHSGQNWASGPLELELRMAVRLWECWEPTLCPQVARALTDRALSPVPVFLILKGKDT